MLTLHSNFKQMVKPYEDRPGSKKEQVTEMFNRIAGTYDVLNRVLSLGIDKGWRKTLVKRLSKSSPMAILDIATGTGDLAIAIGKKNPTASITGLDIAKDMLEVGQKKIADKNMSHQIKLEVGDGEALPYSNQSFDAVTVAFGVRNFEDLDKGLQEIHRVLKPGGQVWILEFSQPSGWFRPIFLLYFKYLLPLVGRLTSKDPKAYQYLFESVQVFPEGKAFNSRLDAAGFKATNWQPLTFGTCSIYNAKH